MSPFHDFYEEPTVLSATTGHQRIFAQVSYRSVRHLSFVPIVLSEAARMARLFPLCWRMSANGPVLGVLRSLMSNGAGHPPDAPMHEALLPLFLQAFPIVVPGEEDIERQQLLFDATIADQPTDIGAPLLMGDGQLSRAALGRARTAVSLGRAMVDVKAMSHDLLVADLLEPWPLKFDLGHGRTVEIGDLLVLSAARLHHDEVSEVVLLHGIMAGLALSLHRASLFRIGTLLTAARRAVAEAARPVEPESVLPT